MKRSTAALFVGTEEVDWLLCDAYHDAVGSLAPRLSHSAKTNANVLSEGAGAVLCTTRGSFYN